MSILNLFSVVYELVFLGVLIIVIILIILWLNLPEPNRCRICSSVLRVRRTQTNRLCHKHERKYSKFGAGIIPYKYWKQIAADKKVTEEEYNLVMKKLEKLGYKPTFWDKEERKDEIEFDNSIL